MDELYPYLRNNPVHINPIEAYKQKFVSFQPTEYKIDYYNRIRKIHIEYNQRNGKNTVNLCPNPRHYIQETLGYNNGIKKSNSFKKLTLGKLKSKRKTKLPILKRKMDRSQEKLFRLKKEIEEQEKLVKEYTENYTKEFNFCKNVESIK